MNNLGDVIIKPIVSEKSYAERKMGKYTFKVQQGATKTDIKNAVEKFFGVTVTQIQTANINGSKTRNTRYSRRSIDTSYKKARVRLADGQKIEAFEEKTEDSKGKGSKGKSKEKAK